MEYAESTSPVEALEQFATGVPRPRGDSTAGMAAAGSNGLLPHSRSRSASSPQAFLPPGVPRAPMPPVQHQQWPDQNGGGAGPAANGGNGNGAVRPEKRFSSSSISTVDSAQSGQSRPQSTAASSPTTLNGSSGSLGGHPSRTSSNATPTGRDSRVFQAATAIKVQVHFGDDRFVVVVLSSITFDELVEKVSKKVKLCSGRRPMPEAGSAGAPGTGTAGTLRIRYIDEDGDRIMMHDDDDVQMAFESSKATGTDVELVVS